MAAIKTPIKTSDRKRVNKNFIVQMAKFRGYMTSNEKTSLATLDVKNAIQRINNRTMSDDVTTQLSANQNKLVQGLMKDFVKNVNTIINSK